MYYQKGKFQFWILNSKKILSEKGFEVYQNLGYQHDENTETIPGSMSSKATKV